VRAHNCYLFTLLTIFTTFPSHAAVQLGRLMFPLFALALELPEDYFEDKASLQEITRFLLLTLT